MTIREYIKQHVFLPRVQERGCLVIYDPTRRYREVALSMASTICEVVDVSSSPITQRELLHEAFARLASGKIHHLIVWIPRDRPQDTDARQKDPFSFYGMLGAEFPAGDGDSYQSLCRRAKPDHVSEINKLFQDQHEPSFEVLDALDQGATWPTLKTLLGVESSREILIGLLAPNEEQSAGLTRNEDWVAEAREFVERSLGTQLKTKGKTLASIREELWQLVLFSEFVFDSAGSVPASLGVVPRVEPGAAEFVFSVCQALRSNDQTKALYTTKAMEIEAALNLPERCAEMIYLGVRDTFAFEERFYLRTLVEHAIAGRLDRAAEIHASRKKSIWINHEERVVEWTLAARALELLDVVAQLAEPRFKSLEEIVRGYAQTWRELDRHHRQFEQAVLEWDGDHAPLEKLIHHARDAYRREVESLQTNFIALLQKEGWPLAGAQLISNSQVFDKLVGPALDAGERVAYFLVDSLRYELGIELEKLLAGKHGVSVSTVCAQFPTYTEVGMASLMPKADSALALAQDARGLVATLASKPATTPAARFDYLRSIKGDLCAEVDLETLNRGKKMKVLDSTKLLVVRTSEIDAIAHTSPRQVLQLIPSLVRQVFKGVNRVAELGFDRAVIATDHGFILLHEQAAGDLATKPQGRWLVEKTRCLLGSGIADSQNLVLKKEEIGVRGDFEHLAAPKTMVPYSRGELYFHEGISLQECVLPCITVTLQRARAKQKARSLPNILLTYKQGKTAQITQRRPVVALAWPEGELFAEESELEVMIEITDSKGNHVGQTVSGPTVNDATGGVRIRPGSAVSVAISMDDHFEGSFTIRVIDPTTSVQLAPELSLKTNYLA